jgi:hypothetical protein
MTLSIAAHRLGLFVCCLAIFGQSASTAQAFYFKGWPGSGQVYIPTLMSSKAPHIGGPSLGEDFNTTTSTPQPPGTNRITERPPGVPEPATAVIAATGIGLAVLGRKLWKKDQVG